MDFEVGSSGGIDEPMPMVAKLAAISRQEEAVDGGEAGKSLVLFHGVAERTWQEF